MFTSKCCRLPSLVPAFHASCSPSALSLVPRLEPAQPYMQTYNRADHVIADFVANARPALPLHPRQPLPPLA